MNSSETESLDIFSIICKDTEEKKPKKKSKYCEQIEKKFPKIRISNEDYLRLKDIRMQFKFKSFGKAIELLIDCYKKELQRVEEQVENNKVENN